MMSSCSMLVPSSWLVEGEQGGGGERDLFGSASSCQKRGGRSMAIVTTFWKFKSCGKRTPRVSSTTRGWRWMSMMKSCSGSKAVSSSRIPGTGSPSLLASSSASHFATWPPEITTWACPTTSESLPTPFLSLFWKSATPSRMSLLPKLSSVQWQRLIGWRLCSCLRRDGNCHTAVVLLMENTSPLDSLGAVVPRSGVLGSDVLG